MSALQVTGVLGSLHVVGASGYVVQAAAIVRMVGPGGGVVLSNAVPVGLGVASAGTSPEASRSDHVHPPPSATLITAGTFTPAVLPDIDGGTFF